VLFSEVLLDSDDAAGFDDSVDDEVDVEPLEVEDSLTELPLRP